MVDNLISLEDGLVYYRKGQLTEHLKSGDFLVADPQTKLVLSDIIKILGDNFKYAVKVLDKLWLWNDGSVSLELRLDDLGQPLTSRKRLLR